MAFDLSHTLNMYSLPLFLSSPEMPPSSQSSALFYLQDLHTRITSYDLKTCIHVHVHTKLGSSMHILSWVVCSISQCDTSSVPAHSKGTCTSSEVCTLQLRVFLPCAC